MFHKVYLVIFIFFGVFSDSNCRPRSISSHKERFRRAYSYGVNVIDRQEEKSTSDEVAASTILLRDEPESNPWETLVLSLRNGLPPTDHKLKQSFPGYADRDRQRFAHFYKRKPSEQRNVDPIVFPTISDESPTIIYREEAVTQSSSAINVSTERTAEKLVSSEDDVSSQSSSTETEAASQTLDLLSTWLWENLPPPTSQVQSTATSDQSDIGTHSLYHGPKIKKGKLTKVIVCPPGQRPNHFGECKRPITLKQSDYEE